MDNMEFQSRAINLIQQRHRELTGNHIGHEDIYVVWLSKVLQNNKAMLSTNVSDGRYYEVTYNGTKEEFYVDVYKKTHNTCYPLKS